MRKRNARSTGLAKLKIGFNKVFGYYLEVSKRLGDKVPEHYIRKQTLVNAERFITPELKEFENKILGAEERRLELEYHLFCEIRRHLARGKQPDSQDRPLPRRRSIFSGTLAEIARNYHYRRPEIDDCDEILISERAGIR